MAQWLGAYSGLTHETKMQDIEASLRKAVKAFAAASGLERDLKLENIRHLSERLLAARLKVLRAKISALAVTASKGAEIGKQMTRLERREQELQEQGIDGILAEFAVPNLNPR